MSAKPLSDIARFAALNGYTSSSTFVEPFGQIVFPLLHVINRYISRVPQLNLFTDSAFVREIVNSKRRRDVFERDPV